MEDLLGRASMHEPGSLAQRAIRQVLCEVESATSESEIGPLRASAAPTHDDRAAHPAYTPTAHVVPTELRVLAGDADVAAHRDVHAIPDGCAGHSRYGR